MKPIANHLLSVTLLAIVLVGCFKKEPADEIKVTKEEEHHADNIVELSPTNLTHMTLNVATAQMGSLGMTLKAAGRVSVNLNKTARVAPTLEGRLIKLNVDLNDSVQAGQVLALVETPELLGKDLALKTPMSGIVIERTATVGELVDKSKAIYTISDPTQLWVIAEIKERDIALVKLAQAAAFTVLAYPQETFHGQVVLLGNQVETASRTLEVRIVVDNTDGRLKPGMFADVEITTTLLDNVLLIPSSALQTIGEDQIVFVALNGSKFEKRVVKLGPAQQGRVQVLAGVQSGEQVVTTGSFILKSQLLKSEMGGD